MYHSRYFGGKHRKKSFPRGFIALLFFLGLIGLGIFFLLESGFFRVTGVNVSGSDPALSAAISQYMKDNFRFFINSQTSTAQKLSLAFPQVENVSVYNDIFTRTLNASYNLREGHFLWCKQSCYMVDVKGVIFAPSQITQASFLTTVKDEYFTNIEVGKKIPNNYIETLLTLEAITKDKGLEVERYMISNIFSLRVKLKSNGELKFTMQHPIKDQAENFTTFYDSLPKEEFAKLQYVDLRVKDKVYYK